MTPTSPMRDRELLLDEIADIDRTLESKRRLSIERADKARTMLDKLAELRITPESSPESAALFERLEGHIADPERYAVWGETQWAASYAERLDWIRTVRKAIANGETGTATDAADRLDAPGWSPTEPDPDPGLEIEFVPARWGQKRIVRHAHRLLRDPGVRGMRLEGTGPVGLAGRVAANVNRQRPDATGIARVDADAVGELIVLERLA